jgi:hypothetical protein
MLNGPCCRPFGQGDGKQRISLGLSPRDPAPASGGSEAGQLREQDRCGGHRANVLAVAAGFAREPRSPYDAHRPVRDDEDLDQIFTWQEERKLSKNLTLHYKRVTSLVEPGLETLPLAGERCRIHEHEEGRIEVRNAGQLLP